MIRAVALTTFFLCFAATFSYAVEIKNAISKQEGNSIVCTYDLPGKPGEKKATVKIALVIGGERYTPDRLSVSGDFGANISIGLRKKVVWNVLKDMPAGYQGELIWEIDADAEIYDPFKMYANNKKVKPPIVSGDSISDPNSKLTWFRHPNKLKRTSCAEDANAMVARLNNSNMGGHSDWRVPKKSEIDSLVKLLSAYGYIEGQSMFNYLGKVGFQVAENIKIWAIDKSSSERTGSTVFVSSSQQVNGNVSARTTGSSTSSNNVGRSYTSRGSYAGRGYTAPSRSSSGSYDSSRSTSVAGNAEYNGSLSVARTAVDSGLYDVYLDSSTGYFMKQIQNQMISILPVRGDGSTDIYAIAVRDSVNVAPQ